MYVSLASALLLGLAGANLQGDARVGGTLSQGLGELPTGEGGGGSVLSYDTILQPELQLRLAGTRLSASLSYDPRLLMRVRLPEGASANTLDAGGRPFLVSHTLTGQMTYRFTPRWNWSNTVSANFGEQDFAEFAEQGTGAGGDGAGGVAPGGATGLPVSPVIENNALSVRSVLIGPLIGHNDFRTELSLDLSAPGDIVMGGMPVAPNPDDLLCLGDAGGDAGSVALALSDTCELGLSTGTLTPISSVDSLETRVSYRAIDFDPGPFLHALSADVMWRRSFARSIEGRFRAGGILALNPDAVAGEDPINALPRLDVGIAILLVNLRMLRVSLDAQIGADGFVEPQSRQYLTQATAGLALVAVVDRNVDISLSVTGSTLGPELGCPPRISATTGGISPGCPATLPPGEAEIADLTAVSTGLRLGWTVDRNVSFVGEFRYAFRGPHLSRIGAETVMMPDAPVQSNREISALLGVRVAYSTRNDLGRR